MLNFAWISFYVGDFQTDLHGLVFANEPFSFQCSILIPLKTSENF